MSTPTKEPMTVSLGTGAPAAPEMTPATAPAVAPPPPPPEPPEPAEPAEDIPEEYRDQVDETGASLLQRAKTGMQGHLERQVEARRKALEAQQLGEPTVGSYVAFDLFAFTPVQFGGPPPYQPSKIIAGGEFAVIFAVMLVNPVIDIPNGFAVQPTVQLSGRRWRVTLEQINLTDVLDGPDAVRQGRFTAPAASLTLIRFPFRAPNPGRKPRFLEANLAVDIVDPALPYAAFASTIIDVDRWVVQQNIPLRYLVYPQ